MTNNEDKEDRPKFSQHCESVLKGAKGMSTWHVKLIFLVVSTNVLIENIMHDVKVKEEHVSYIKSLRKSLF